MEMLQINKEAGGHTRNIFMKPFTKTLMVIVIFSVAMAALESAVVVYLRALYYRDGFTVAFKLIDKQIISVEILREVATLLMLWSVAYLTGKNRKERIAYFLICFAVWDIFYYIWLKVFIDWPSSFFEWDILFLIPFTWLGPVLSPIICSVTMIVLAVRLLRSSPETKISIRSKLLIGAGCVIILFTYLIDYGKLLWANDLMTEYVNLLSNKKFIQLASVYLPEYYNWTLFWLGELLILTGIFMIDFAFTPAQGLGDHHKNDRVLSKL